MRRAEPWAAGGGGVTALLAVSLAGPWLGVGLQAPGPRGEAPGSQIEYGRLL